MDIEFTNPPKHETDRIARALERNRHKRNAIDLGIPLLDSDREEARRMLESLDIRELEILPL